MLRKSKKKLELSKETLRRLNQADLGRVVGGSGDGCDPADVGTVICSKCTADFSGCQSVRADDSVWACNA